MESPGNPSFAKRVTNQPYDEALSVHDDEEIASVLTPTPRVPRGRATTSGGSQMSGIGSDDEFDHENLVEQPAKVPQPAQRGAMQNGHVPNAPLPSQPKQRPPAGTGDGSEEEEDDDEEDENQSSSEDDDEEEAHGALEGAYDPAEYEHLPVSQEIKELFQYITRYTPQNIELEYKLKPFIPEYIPSVGDIDAFLKVSRPDGKPETLGLSVLDEPAAKQSDPTVLDLQLRSISKQTTAKQMTVRSLDDVEKNPKALDTWIESIDELHRQKPPQTVHYSKTMPDIETLMQEWPPDFEEILKTVSLPGAEIDCDLNQYVDIICSILDIPVHKSRIQSLHVLFTLYSEFKNSQHFNQLARDNLLSNELKGASGKSFDEEQNQALSFE